MGRAEKPVYASKPQGKNIWQEYRVFADRIELDSRLWGTLTVPMHHLERVRVAQPLVVCDLFRGELDLGDLLRTAKMDLADLAEHVSIEKDTGFWRQFRITPDDPEAFVAAVEKARGRTR